ncbi:hypothetical protein ACLOJK_018826, partial [Asimina triloba]
MVDLRGKRGRKLGRFGKIVLKGRCYRIFAGNPVGLVARRCGQGLCLCPTIIAPPATGGRGSLCLQGTTGLYPLHIHYDRQGLASPSYKIPSTATGIPFKHTTIDKGRVASPSFYANTSWYPTKLARVHTPLPLQCTRGWCAPDHSTNLQ